MMLAPAVKESLDVRDAAEWLRLARRGDFAGAWNVSDRIRARRGGNHDPAVPRHLQQIWDGEDLARQRVLVRCYHGLGDTIQFIRYAPNVRALAREVIVWAQPALLPLLRRVRGIDRLLPLHAGEPDVRYDVDVEVMELPYVFRSTLSTIPSTVPYLAAAPAPIDGSRPRVGVVWRGGDWDENRSIPFSIVSRLFELPSVSWYALQADARPDERSPRLTILDTRGIVLLAEAMRALDLVISIDSMPAHLAGALGVPVWTLLPRVADWRWMEHRSDSPWYPTMRLFRQSVAGKWDAVIEDVRRALD